MLKKHDADAHHFILAEADIAKAHARGVKGRRNRYVGSPIELKGKAIQMVVRDGCAWTAESGGVARKVELETNKTLQIYKGHDGPVTTLDFYTPPPSDPSSPSSTYLITGAWDKHINVWNTKTKALVSSTLAHGDFVKKVLVIPELKLLVSAGSDKLVKLWDLSVLPPNAGDVPPGFTLPQVGSLSAHTRPVEALAVDLSAPISSSKPMILYTGDTMGIIKVWSLEPPENNSTWRPILKGSLDGHRTGVTAMIVDQGIIWSGAYERLRLSFVESNKPLAFFCLSCAASLDSTVILQTFPPSIQYTPPPRIHHKYQCRAMLVLHLPPHSLSRPILLTGSADTIKIWDVSAFGEPGGEVEFLSAVDDGHWHDITTMCVWLRDKKDEEGCVATKGKGKEVWIVSAGLDGTIRRWKLDALLSREVTIASEEDQGPREFIPQVDKEMQELSEFLEELEAADAPTEEEVENADFGDLLEWSESEKA
ncbi:hypothetical protein BOTBODRAFT_157068 [Botryobasidium botryosum FD-172 SS1]|uniref:Uncharacterized protein n=1 Tax=Botryobasidium botryosum (strain FD-172 SS1) TaxID=930990 RepID=A0A067MXG6_BOTB1|nr:hypothetical protein BOTBODRAFT_157068 [Botryobasidium botryosum FD-172 SS1]